MRQAKFFNSLLEILERMSDMEVTMAYGHVKEQVRLPEGDRITVCKSPRSIKEPEDQVSLIRKALSDPIGTPSLRDVVEGKKKVCILISDHTRPTPSRIILPCLLEELSAGGIEEDNVMVVVAGGLHDRAGLDAWKNILGEDLFNRVRLVIHDPDSEDLVLVGKTSQETPVRVNREVAGANFSISVGTIEPHLFYGWSGGAKNVLPGISARKTVYFHHNRFSKYPRGLDYIDGNLNRKDAEEAARIVGVNFICNVVLNEKRNIIGVFAGDIVEAHRAGVQFGRQFVVVNTPEMADIVVSALGGSPRDSDFWQAEGKALMHAQHLVKDGGIMILAAGCEKGIGGEAWRQLLLKTPAEITDLYLTSNFSVPLMKANDLVNSTIRAKLWLVCPGICRSDLPQIPVKFFPTITDALIAAKQKVAGQAAVIMIPDASRVVVTVNDV